MAPQHQRPCEGLSSAPCRHPRRSPACESDRGRAWEPIGTTKSSRSPRKWRSAGASATTVGRRLGGSRRAVHWTPPMRPRALRPAKARYSEPKLAHGSRWRVVAGRR
eukprot:2424065-Prymnesium_polylepis.1